MSGVMLQRVTDGGFRSPSDPGERGYSEPRPRVSVSEREARLLEILAAFGVVLEIGTGLGVSTRALAASAALVVTVDTDSWVRDVIRPTLPPEVVFCAHPIDVPNHRFDLIFIDGNHAPGNVVADVRFALTKIRPGGLILAHDFNAEHVAAAARTVIPKWSLIRTEYGIGVAVA